MGLWWATDPTLPQYWPNFTPNYGVMMSRWIFSVLFELIIVNWNPFQRWFSEVAPVSWHINFISRSYGWGVRARFVIFGCSLPHLTSRYSSMIGIAFALNTTHTQSMKQGYYFDRSAEGLFWYTNFIPEVAQRTKIIKLSHLYLYDIQTDHI